MPAKGPAPISRPLDAVPRPSTPYTGCVGVKRPGDSYDRPRGSAEPLRQGCALPISSSGSPEEYPRWGGTHAGAFALTGVKGGPAPPDGVALPSPKAKGGNAPKGWA